jgi:hypothetical protein
MTHKQARTMSWVSGASCAWFNVRFSSSGPFGLFWDLTTRVLELASTLLYQKLNHQQP